MSILPLFRTLFAEICFFVFAALCGVVIIMSFGWIEWIALNISLILGFLIVSFIRNFFWRAEIRKDEKQTVSQVRQEFLFFFVIAQLVLITLIPRSSVIPLGILERLHIISRIEGTECFIDAHIERTKSLWKDNLDYSPVVVMEGGMPHTLFLLKKWNILKNPDIRGAQTFGNTIYIPDQTSCTPVEVIFHEMTHVWQMQIPQKNFFGLRSIPKWIMEAYTQIKNPQSLYDYKGPSGLDTRKKEGKVFSDFGIEMQAMIVEDWYLSTMGYQSSIYGYTFTPHYKELLTYYIDSMLTQ